MALILVRPSVELTVEVSVLTVCLMVLMACILRERYVLNRCLSVLLSEVVPPLVILEVLISV